MHLPAEHVSVAAQRTPQPPQLFESVFVFTHAPPHTFVVPDAQHVLETHIWPVAHAVLQPPQCAGSVVGSTQLAPPQSSVPPAQVEEQLPAEQRSIALHAWPQVPQFFESVSGFVQTPLHTVVVPPGQQVLDKQISPDAHALLQLPQ